VRGGPIARLRAGPSTDAELSEADLRLLRSYVNPTYLEAAAWGKIQAKFKEDGSVQLHRFLLPALADRVQAAASKVRVVVVAGHARSAARTPCSAARCCDAAGRA
jgi:hypothetical protein